MIFLILATLLLSTATGVAVYRHRAVRTAAAAAARSAPARAPAMSGGSGPAAAHPVRVDRVARASPDQSAVTPDRSPQVAPAVGRATHVPAIAPAPRPSLWQRVWVAADPADPADDLEH